MAATELAVFDLDGTLIDSRRDLADSANELLAAYGAPPLAEEDIVSMIGCGAAVLVKRVTGSGSRRRAARRGARSVPRHLQRPIDQPYAACRRRPRMLDDVRASDIAVALLTNSRASTRSRFGRLIWRSTSVGRRRRRALAAQTGPGLDALSDEGGGPGRARRC
jgi:phosphoglycolate phosphatase-like HAD superfamily hydrolase